MSSLTWQNSCDTAGQANFNPSWMPQKATVKPDKTDMNDDEKACEPIFSKYSYGREDLLALEKIDSNTKPPSGIENCIFYVPKPQEPMLMLPFTEGELRLHNNINSSKALSSFGRSDKYQTNGGTGTDNFSTGQRPTTQPFQRRQNDFHNQQTSANNRWSTLNTTSNSTNRPWKTHERGREKSVSTTNYQSSDSTFNNPIPNDNNADLNGSNKLVNKSSVDDNALTQQFQSTSMAPKPKEYDNKNDQHDSNQGTGKIQQKNDNSSSSSTTTLVSSKWNYLDPSGIERGPFDSQQMQTWYSSGYFNNTLMLCRLGDTSYISLGELITKNGTAPFADQKRDSPNLPTGLSYSESNVVHSKQGLAGTRGTDLPGENHVSPRLVDVEKIWSNTALEESATNKVLMNMERHFLEEQKKLNEKEEMLKRDEQDRLEKERRIKEMEQELNRQKEELSRLAFQKERELEIRCLQVAEIERKRREELELLEQKIKNEQIQQHLRKEEEDRIRRREMEEMMKREQERQRQVLEGEAKRIREEEEVRLRQIAFQEAQRIAALTETKRLEEERARKAEEARRITAEKELLQKTQAIKNSSQQKGSKPPPVFNQVHETRQQVWNVVGQQSAAVPVDWTIPKNVQQPPKAPTYHVEPQQPPRTWNPITAPIPATIPMPNSKIPSKQTTQSSQKPVAQKKTTQQPEKLDQFTSWIVKRVRDMNSDVDAEVFASFIEGIDSPNEIEDYIIGYLGDSKPVRDFHRELLSKRIELRPRTRAAVKDDLSRPAVALTNDDKLSSSQNIDGANNNKKKKKTQKVLDPRSLGFRPSGNPNRINAGEIDTTIPSTTATKKKH